MPPTFDECWTQIKNGTAIIDSVRVYGKDTLIALLDTYVQSLEGDRSVDGGVNSQALRASVANLYDGGSVFIEPHLIDIAEAIASDAESAESVLVDLYRYMNDNGYRIKSRAWVFGAVSAGGSNVGNGTIYQLVFDEWGQVIEAVNPTVTTFRCIQDSNSGSPVGKEVFEVFQGNQPQDDLQLDGAGYRGTLTGHAGDEVLKNASFQTFSGTAAAPTAITNWTSSVAVSGTTFEFSSNSNNYYRKSPEEAAAAPSTGGTPYGLIVKSTCTLQQKLRTFGTTLSFNVPYVFLIRWRRDPTGFTAGTGSITLRMGSNATGTVVVAAQSGWATLAVTMTTSNWLKNFNEDDLDLMIDMTVSSGVFCIDDCNMGAMSQFNGIWYFGIGGSTNWLREDKYTFTNTETGAKIQREINHLYPGFYLPSAAAPPIACTAALAGLGAGNVNNGSHVYAVTIVDANGIESPVGASSNSVTTSGGNGQVALTAIPLGPTGTASRKVYRSAAGTTTPLKLLTTISGNVTTTYADNTADGSLGATVNSLTAILDP